MVLPTLARRRDPGRRTRAQPERQLRSVMRALDTKRLIEACRAGTVSELLCASPSPTAADVVSVIRSSTSLDPSYRTRMLEGAGDGGVRSRRPARRWRPRRARRRSCCPRCRARSAMPAPAARTSHVGQRSRVQGLAGGKNDGMRDEGGGPLHAAARASQQRSNAGGLAGALRSARRTPAGPGAQISSMKSYFEDRGYAFTEAWDGPL